MKQKVLSTLQKVSETGFDKNLVECVLNMVEMNNKQQRSNFGIEMCESMVGMFNYQNYQAVSNFLNISSNFVIYREHD
jgi:Zn-dependent M16 (insulinase) family peptidase